MQSHFDDAIRVRPGEGDGEYLASPTEDWAYGRAVNGGFLMALAANALRERVGAGEHAEPVALSAYFLTATTPGDVTLRTEVLRTGRRLSTGQVAILQDSSDGPVERVRTLMSLGDLGTSTSAELTIPPPDMPGPDDGLSHEEAWAALDAPTPLVDRVDIRLDPATNGWATGKPSGRGESRGWLRFRDERPSDPLALLLALDALPPTVFDLGIFGWAPTLEFSAQLRARPRPGWVRLASRTEDLADGRAVEDCRAWDESGRLVAQSRQLAGVVTPRPDAAADR